MKALLTICLALAVAIPVRAESEWPINLGKTKDGHSFLDIRIAEVCSTPDGGLRIIGRGDFKGELAGIELVLGSRWRRLASGNQFIGDAKILSRGEQSRVFTMALADTLNKDRVVFRSTDFEVDGILSDNPSTISAKPFWVELVYGALPSSAYAEMYVYIDIKGRRMRVRESDARWRDQLLRLFAGAR